MNIFIGDNPHICKDIDCKSIPLESTTNKWYYYPLNADYWDNEGNEYCIQFPFKSESDTFYLVQRYLYTNGNYNGKYKYKVYNTFEELVKEYKTRFINKDEFEELITTFHLKIFIYNYYYEEIKIMLIGHINKPCFS